MSSASLFAVGLLRGCRFFTSDPVYPASFLVFRRTWFPPLVTALSGAVSSFRRRIRLSAAFVTLSGVGEGVVWPGDVVLGFSYNLITVSRSGEASALKSRAKEVLSCR